MLKKKIMQRIRERLTANGRGEKESASLADDAVGVRPGEGGGTGGKGAGFVKTHGGGGGKVVLVTYWSGFIGRPNVGGSEISRAGGRVGGERVPALHVCLV